VVNNISLNYKVGGFLLGLVVGHLFARFVLYLTVKKEKREEEETGEEGELDG